jgi:hypothetical protein
MYDEDLIELLERLEQRILARYDHLDDAIGDTGDDVEDAEIEVEERHDVFQSFLSQHPELDVEDLNRQLARLQKEFERASAAAAADPAGQRGVPRTATPEAVNAFRCQLQRFFPRAGGADAGRVGQPVGPRRPPAARPGGSTRRVRRCAPQRRSSSRTAGCTDGSTRT